MHAMRDTVIVDEVPGVRLPLGLAWIRSTFYVLRSTFYALRLRIGPMRATESEHLGGKIIAIPVGELNRVVHGLPKLCPIPHETEVPWPDRTDLSDTRC
jgi:hypothetical protein